MRSGIGVVGRRADLAALEVDELAVVLEPAAGHEAAQHVDHLVHALAAPLPRHVHRGEVLGPRADADAEPQPVVAQHRDARGLLGDEHDGPDRELQHERREADALVRAARYGMSVNGSMIGLSSRNARSPSAVYG